VYASNWTELQRLRKDDLTTGYSQFSMNLNTVPPPSVGGVDGVDRGRRQASAASRPVPAASKEVLDGSADCRCVGHVQAVVLASSAAALAGSPPALARFQQVMRENLVPAGAATSGIEKRTPMKAASVLGGLVPKPASLYAARVTSYS